MSECFKTNVLPDNLVNVFANVDKEDRSNNQSFWLFVEALQVFYQDFKRLPLSGVVPDMISTTENYLTLQRIYIDQAERDKKALHAILEEICKKKHFNAGLVSYPPEEEFVLFCKNCAQIEFVMMLAIAHEFSNTNWDDVASEMQDPESCASWLIAMRAFEAVYDRTGQAPGEDLAKAPTEL